MTAPTLATALPGPAQIRAAAEDYEVFHALRNTLPEDARELFDHEVDREYDAIHGKPPARALTGTGQPGSCAATHPCTGRAAPRPTGTTAPAQTTENPGTERQHRGPH